MRSHSYQAIGLTGTALDTEQGQNDTLAAPQQQPSDATVPVVANKQLSPLDATIHLVKGNLGPGCLNLPHAFALTGWALGSGLFALIALQGIYSMCLLLYCKNLLQERNNNSGINTFMDVARTALGFGGGRIVEIFLFVLQGGVCCVFLSLISTNLRSAIPNLSAGTSVFIVTLGLMGMVRLRFLKDLFWLCATANAFMITAILTAAIAGLMNYIDHRPNTVIVTANATPFSIITFTSDMFFAFEGIGLVLPVENSFGIQRRSFANVLVSSMSLVASLFVLIGVLGSIGFPDIRSGSVTAYLEREYPNVIWYSITNALVIIAVAFTFPLQLTPAMEVLDSWLDDTGGGELDSRLIDLDRIPTSDEDEDNIKVPQLQHESLPQKTVILQDELGSACNEPSQQSCYTANSWIFRRWTMVILCAVIVLLVNDLGILMSLFGAVGQTGLAGMPCAVHLALQYQGIAPKNSLWSLVNVMILLFCTAVMLTGCFLVAKELT
jgi:amino acid permease